MQTFVPFDNFIESSKSLDNRRLNKQLLEGRQIYKIIYTDQRSGAWANHPAVKMWRGCDTALFNYLVAIKNECVSIVASKQIRIGQQSRRCMTTT